MYICITESLCCTPETNTTLKINYILQFLKMVKKKEIKYKRKKKKYTH